MRRAKGTYAGFTLLETIIAGGIVAFSLVLLMEAVFSYLGSSPGRPVVSWFDAKEAFNFYLSHESIPLNDDYYVYKKGKDFKILKTLPQELDALAMRDGFYFVLNKDAIIDGGSDRSDYWVSIYSYMPYDSLRYVLVNKPQKRRLYAYPLCIPTQ